MLTAQRAREITLSSGESNKLLQEILSKIEFLANEGHTEGIYYTTNSTVIARLKLLGFRVEVYYDNSFPVPRRSITVDWS